MQLWWTPLALLAVAVALVAAQAITKSNWIWKVLAGVGLVMLAVGGYLGLVWAPPERDMGDVARIMYAHVPQIWIALLSMGVNFVASTVFLFKKSWFLDSVAEASAEIGLYFGSVGVLLGSIWAKPTWGVWWDWDPRLTTAAIMLVIYGGYLALRKFVDDPDKRAAWSAVVAIIAFVDVMVVWKSVQWWKSLHQVQSTPKTLDPEMTFSLRWNAVAFFFLWGAFLWHRYLLARAARDFETAPPPALNPRSDS